MISLTSVLILGGEREIVYQLTERDREGFGYYCFCYCFTPDLSIPVDHSKQTVVHYHTVERVTAVTHRRSVRSVLYLGTYMEEEIPVIDISKWITPGISNSDDAAEDSRRLANALHRFGIVLVKDPRVSKVDNNAFIDQMETYYAQSDGVTDARPEVHYTYICMQPRLTKWRVMTLY